MSRGARWRKTFCAVLRNLDLILKAVQSPWRLFGSWSQDWFSALEGSFWGKGGRGVKIRN